MKKDQPDGKKQSKLLAKIPALLSSRVSVYIYLFLFFYLVIYALLCYVLPALQPYAPSNNTQLIMGNYTNVLSALGASLAAGSSLSAHTGVKKLHRRHDELQDSIKELGDALQKLQDTADKKEADSNH